MLDIRKVLGFSILVAELLFLLEQRGTMRTSVVEQRVTFQENLRTVHIIWQDETAYASFGTGGKTTKKRVYKELFGKKARKRYAELYPYLTKKEINEVVKIHAQHLKTATIVMHAASLLHGELRRANLEARRLTEALTA